MAKSKLDMGKVILAGGVGVVDLYAEKLDADATPVRTEALKRWKDYFRMLAFGGGLAAQVWFPKYDRWGEAASIAATPLLIRSINDSIEVIKPKAMRPTTRIFAPTQVSRGIPQHVAQRYPAPEFQNQFKNIRL